MIGTLIITYLIQFNILHSIKFELQHALFMIIVAFATVTTGGILRHKLIITGGILFGLFALLSTYVPVEYQFLTEALAWLIAFVIPGHILYAKRNS
jgi:branched-subunit amino acid ABC-type transport system permease component